METVRCEELQLELSAALKSKTSRQIQHHGSAVTSSGTATVTWAPTPTQLPSQHHHHHHQSQQQQHHHLSQSTSQQSKQQSQQGTEIDRIMAKIEQARLSIANVCDNLNKETKQTHNQFNLIVIINVVLCE